MMYTIYYKHTFECDVFFALSKRQAKKKALAILAQEFDGASFPLKGHNCGEDFVANSLEDFIEDIGRENLFVYYWRLWFDN